MRNKYAGECYRCGGTVAAGEGHFEKVTNVQRRKGDTCSLPNWLTQHAHCAIRFRGTDRHFRFAPEA